MRVRGAFAVAVLVGLAACSSVQSPADTEQSENSPSMQDSDETWRAAAQRCSATADAQLLRDVDEWRLDELCELADRLVVYGLHLNGVPESRLSFVDWQPGPKSNPDCWRDAARIYRAVLTRSTDYRVAIRLGRTYGFLQDWPNAASVYAKLFEEEPIVAKDKLKLDREVLKAKPELTLACLEWGVAERMAAQGAINKVEKQDRLNRCIGTILLPLSWSIKPDSDSEVFWGANYHLVRALMDKGLYMEAQLKIDDLRRSVSPTFDDGKFGYRKLFEELR